MGLSQMACDRNLVVSRESMLLLLLSRFSHVRLCDPRAGSPPSSSVPGILQARTLEWVAISFSMGWSGIMGEHRCTKGVKETSRLRSFLGLGLEGKDNILTSEPVSQSFSVSIAWICSI